MPFFVAKISGESFVSGETFATRVPRMASRRKRGTRPVHGVARAAQLLGYGKQLLALENG